MTENKWFQSCLSYSENKEEYANYSVSEEFEWLKSFLHLETIEINRQEKRDNHIRYQAILDFLKFTTQKYIEQYQIKYNLMDKDNRFLLKCILYRKIGIDVFANSKMTEDFLSYEKKLGSIDLELPLIFNPEFVFDKFIYHRNSSTITEKDIEQANRSIQIYEQFYYSIVNQMEEMMSRPESNLMI